MTCNPSSKFSTKKVKQREVGSVFHFLYLATSHQHRGHMEAEPRFKVSAERPESRHPWISVPKIRWSLTTQRAHEIKMTSIRRHHVS